MNLAEMKQKTLALIEEYSPDNEKLTDDDDLAAKFNSTANSVMFELARIKKIPKYVEIAVSKGDILTLEDIGKECGYEIYQLEKIGGANFDAKANGTVFKFTEDGIAEVECFVYPEQITEKTKDKAYEFELSADVLEIMPYGIAADLLKADVSSNYGKVYADRYETMLTRLDPRYHTASITIEGGINI